MVNSKKILVVDDDSDVVLFITTVLKDNGYQTIEAKDGLEGLEMAKAHQPDLILLDLMMPQKSGISLLNDLKEDSNFSTIPVIMVTGVSGETGVDLEAFFETRIKSQGTNSSIKPDGYLEKPIDINKLLTLIKKSI